MGAPTVVFDTNVLVSGFGFGGKPDECFSLALSDDVELVTSTDILHELAVVVEYDRLPFSGEAGREFAGIVGDTARIADPELSIDAVDADPTTISSSNVQSPLTRITSSRAIVICWNSTPIAESRSSSPPTSSKFMSKRNPVSSCRT